MRPSEWIMKRAEEKCRREWQGIYDKVEAGLLDRTAALRSWFPDIEVHVKGRKGWFISEATLEYLDTFVPIVTELSEQMAEIVDLMKECNEHDIALLKEKTDAKR